MGEDTLLPSQPQARALRLIPMPWSGAALARADGLEPGCEITVRSISEQVLLFEKMKSIEKFRKIRKKKRY